MVYPDETVSSYINKTFVPVQIQLGKHPVAEERYSVAWTPTLLFIGDDRHLQYKEEAASYETEDFLAKLKAARARAVFQNENYKKALRLYDNLLDDHPQALFVPEALYWSGVAELKRENKDGLVERWGKLQEEFSESEWARRIHFFG